MEELLGESDVSETETGETARILQYKEESTAQYRELAERSRELKLRLERSETAKQTLEELSEKMQRYQLLCTEERSAKEALIKRRDALAAAYEEKR